MWLQGLYLVQLSQAYDRLSPAGAAGSMGLFSGAGGAGTPIGGLLALVGSSLLMQGGTTNATIMLLLFAILALGNLLLLALPAVPHSPTPPHSDAVQEPETAPGFEIPQLLASSRQARLLMVCTMSSGYANAFMSGSFTLEVVVSPRSALIACSFHGRDWSHGCCHSNRAPSVPSIVCG